MPISIQCKCGKRFNVNEKHIGKTLQCPQCGAQLLVQPEEEPPIDDFEPDESAGLNPVRQGTWRPTFTTIKLLTYSFSIIPVLRVVAYFNMVAGLLMLGVSVLRFLVNTEGRSNFEIMLGASFFGINLIGVGGAILVFLSIEAHLRKIADRH